MNLINRLLFILFITALMPNEISEQIDLLINQYNLKSDKNFILESTIKYSNNINVMKLSPVGFIVTSDHSNHTKILGFSFKNNFNNNFLPYNTRYLLNRYQLELDSFAYVNEIDYTFNSSREVEPLISALWDQGAPFNGMCPAGPPGSSMGNAVVGCVAVGMAQVMHFWQHPPTGVGSVSYYDSNYGQISVDFEEAFYDFESMPNTTANQEVQEILFHAGASAHMDYGPNGSGAAGGPFSPSDYPSAFSALQEHFGYDTSMQFLEKINYTDNQWMDIIKTDLDNSMPVIYDACAQVGCHTWNVDGYNGDYIHCNWGWGGDANGYFLLNNLNPDPGVNFNDDVWAIVGITPGDLVLLGDVNLDNTINIQDIILTINIILNALEYQQSADLNEDSMIDILDVVMLVNIILQID